MKEKEDGNVNLESQNVGIKVLIAASDFSIRLVIPKAWFLDIRDPMTRNKI